MNMYQDVPAEVVDMGPKDARAWGQLLSPYKNSDNSRAVIESLITFIPYFSCWAINAALFAGGYNILGVLMLLPTSGFLLRLFLIQHDCGHGSFFTNNTANTWMGRILGVLTVTPYGVWQHAHALHHSSSGSLDRRGHGDIDTMTVEEYRNASSFTKLKYRAYRHPFVMFVIGPAYVFLLQFRLPVGYMRDGWKPWASALGTNLFMAILYAGLISLVGWKVFLLVQLPTLILAASIGVWLFFVQHQFEETSWDYDENWNWRDAALEGSSYYVLPPLLQWFSANIGVHHVHHLSSRIPFYRLGQVLKDHPELSQINRLTMVESLKCVPLVLWDEASRTLISFRDARQLGVS